MNLYSEPPVYHRELGAILLYLSGHIEISTYRSDTTYRSHDSETTHEWGWKNCFPSANWSSSILLQLPSALCLAVSYTHLYVERKYQRNFDLVSCIPPGITNACI